MMSTTDSGRVLWQTLVNVLCYPSPVEKTKLTKFPHCLILFPFLSLSLKISSYIVMLSNWKIISKLDLCKYHEMYFAIQIDIPVYTYIVMQSLILSWTLERLKKIKKTTENCLTLPWSNISWGLMVLPSTIVSPLLTNCIYM